MNDVNEPLLKQITAKQVKRRNSLCCFISTLVFWLILTPNIVLIYIFSTGKIPTCNGFVNLEPINNVNTTVNDAVTIPDCGPKGSITQYTGNVYVTDCKHKGTAGTMFIEKNLTVIENTTLNNARIQNLDSPIINDLIASIADLRNLVSNLYIQFTLYQNRTIIPHAQVFRESGTFTVPVNITHVIVQVWGGGGGGGSTTRATYNAGGGTYVYKILDVIPQSIITVYIGKGGKGAQANGNTNGQPGEASYFGPVLASAGNGGQTDNGGGSSCYSENSLLTFCGSIAPSPSSNRIYGPGAPSAMSSGFADINNGRSNPGSANSGAGGAGGSATTNGGDGGSGLVVVNWFAN